MPILITIQLSEHCFGLQTQEYKQIIYVMTIPIDGLNSAFIVGYHIIK